MKISYNWLKEYLPQINTPKKVAELLTQIGLEVSCLQPFALVPKELLIGKVLTCIPHPNADRLKMTTIDIGTEQPLSIVCGAPNVATGRKVVVAPIGTTLFFENGKTLKIKKSKIRGVVSEGMLCAEDEVGLGKEHDGILVLKTQKKVGTPAYMYFHTPPDTIIDIELTPNRADAFSHIGIARDIAAASGKTLEKPIIQPLIPSDSLPFQVSVEDTLACPRYTGIVIKNIVIAPSPIWLQNRLKAIGLAPINNIVDITNFLMYEWGQPLHAFDYDALVKKKLIVKRLPANTSFTTLDGITRKLYGEELMICDSVGPLCMAGILGGERSKVRASTKTIVLESAYFSPMSIAKTARMHKLFTEATFRFERGTDPDLPCIALQRATNLIQTVAQGTIASAIIDHYPKKIQPATITITYAYINKLIGCVLSPTLVHDILKRLDIVVKDKNETGFIAIVPLYRVDVKRPADLVEEILRIYGYNKVVAKNKLTINYTSPASQTITNKNKIATLLVAKGYNQIITNALTKSTYASLTKGLDPAHNIMLDNPLSQSLDSLRQTLLFSGLEIVAHNINHGKPSLKLFELGKEYAYLKGSYQEHPKLGIWLTGNIEGPNWIRKPRQVTLQDLYAVVQQILQQRGITNIEAVPIEHPFYKDCLTLNLDKKIYVRMGQVASSILKHLNIEPTVFFAQIDMVPLLQNKPRQQHYKPIVKFPTVLRDLSLAINSSVTFSQIHKLIKKQAIPQLQNIYMIDYYKGNSIEKDKKAYTLRFVLQSAKNTLKEKEINKIMQQLCQVLQTELGAIIR